MATKTKLYVATAFAAAIFCFSAIAELTCVVTPENDNAWEVVLPGDASAYPIQWSISGDVQDFGGGVTVSFSGCNNTTSIRVTKSQSGTFVPDFGSALGDCTVMLMITMKLALCRCGPLSTAFHFQQKLLVTFPGATWWTAETRLYSMHI